MRSWTRFSSVRALKWSSTRPMSSPDAVAINAAWKKSLRTLGHGARRGNDPDEYRFAERSSAAAGGGQPLRLQYRRFTHFACAANEEGLYRWSFRQSRPMHGASLPGHGRRDARVASGYCAAGPSSSSAMWPFRCRSKNARE